MIEPILTSSGGEPSSIPALKVISDNFRESKLIASHGKFFLAIKI